MHGATCTYLQLTQQQRRTQTYQSQPLDTSDDCALHDGRVQVSVGSCLACRSRWAGRTRRRHTTLSTSSRTRCSASASTSSPTAMTPAQQRCAPRNVRRKSSTTNTRATSAAARSRLDAANRDQATHVKRCTDTDVTPPLTTRSAFDVALPLSTTLSSHSCARLSLFLDNFHVT